MKADQRRAIGRSRGQGSLVAYSTTTTLLPDCRNLAVPPLRGGSSTTNAERGIGHVNILGVQQGVCAGFATPVLAHTCLNVFKINFNL